MNGKMHQGSEENVKVLTFNSMSSKSVLYQFRGSNRVTFLPLLMFLQYDLKMLESQILDSEQSIAYKAYESSRVMKQVQ